MADIAQHVILYAEIKPLWICLFGIKKQDSIETILNKKIRPSKIILVILAGQAENEMLAINKITELQNNLVEPTVVGDTKGIIHKKEYGMEDI
jgi:hypothetical protein